MLFAVYLFFALAAVFGLSGDATPKNHTNIFSLQKIENNYCFNKLDQSLVFENSLFGCVIGEEEFLEPSAINESSERPAALVHQFNLRFLSAQTEARKIGIDIHVSSGYRTLEKQAFLFARAVKEHGSQEEAVKWVLPPEMSRHPWGLAVDVNLDGPKSGAQWLEENGYRFGICRVYENEWWHFEPLVAIGDTCPVLKTDASEDFLRLQSH
ncbi:unannotated protein [freshwater metagenome]|uniref:Unannotated protein n=1 Tax=freshwater metagenome TaxID=449393 RepID=A0A6J7XY11_9ZZZZ|nr:hypothetical protein [Actinomycetota bacterium]